MTYRIEKDSMGEIKVPAEHYWGAQTERSRQYFHIGRENMPPEMIQAFAILKKAAAEANYQLGVLTANKRDAIAGVCDEILAGKLSEEFPLAVWQTGSGTQTNMNVNEVISRRGNELAGKEILHANDHVNMSQSSNDTFPTAMHIAAVSGITKKLIPALSKLIDSLERLEEENQGIWKSGRTHLQDATPILFSQEISGWRDMLEKNKAMILSSMNGLLDLAIGGTAVGTGLNAPKGFAEKCASEISRRTGMSFNAINNKFHALTAKDALVFSHGAFKALAANLMKIANDIRWLASGPRLGLGEIRIPENEPGSSIMPGKVNPTQCEAITMIAVQVMANDVAVGMAASQGNFQLNVFMPVCIYNYLQSLNLLADGIKSFERYCVSGIVADREKMRENVNRSLMNATALNPYIGYDKVAELVKKAYAENKTLREACIELNFLSGEEFDQAMANAMPIE
ncbi:MAG: class II fumarate hydratase [Eubacteriales bacterium]|nr:class II fumarate hydratase [Eubacteriales bacterium]